MEQIKTLQQLKNALSDAGQNPLIDKKPDMELIKSIAKALIYNFIINRGNTTYRIVEIEFYHNHYDPADQKKNTYPRETEAGSWFFHSSGVDITFKSTKQKYGGILIRSIKKDDGSNGKFVCGPQNVVNELFDKFNALDIPNDFPIINVNPTASNNCDIITLNRYHFDKKGLGFCLPKQYWENEGENLYPWNKGTDNLKDSRKPVCNTQQ